MGNGNEEQIVYRALTIQKLLTIFGGLAASIFLLHIWIFPPHDIWALLRTLMSAPTLTLILVTVLGSSWLFPWITKLPGIQALLFPDISGVWHGEIRSNWPVIEKLRNYAASKETLDLSGHAMGSVPPLLVPVDVEIRASFFTVEAHLRTQDGYSKSNTILIQPKPQQEGQNPKLYYFYESQVIASAKSTDVPSHFGAAILEVVRTDLGDLVLEGHYWTDRDWPKGINTAGRIQLKRVNR